MIKSLTYLFKILIEKPIKIIQTLCDLNWSGNDKSCFTSRSDSFVRNDLILKFNILTSFFEAFILKLLCHFAVFVLEIFLNCISAKLLQT